MLGLDPAEVQRQVAASDSAARAATPPAGGDTANRASLGARSGQPQAPKKRTMTTRFGEANLPDGVSEAQMQAVFAKMMSSGGPGGLAGADAALFQKFRAANPQMGQGRRAAGSSPDTRFGGQYIVFVKRGDHPVPVSIRTGLTDLDYSEVVSGLAEGDSVLALPSASLINSQSEMQSRINRMTGGGSVPGMTKAPAATPSAGAARTGRP